MEYNTTRDKMRIGEYGRNIQKMVQIIIAEEDRDKRTQMAKVLVQIMGQMNPTIRESGDFKHKLWDHLHIIADFKLDIDAPYPAPTKEMLEAKPDKIAYSENNIRYKMYGSNIARVIDEAIKFDDGPEKDALVHAIANHLKKQYLAWNRESVDDVQIFEHLKVLSKGKLELKEELQLNTTNEILSRNKKKKPVGKQQHQGKNNPKKKRMMKKRY
jgi:hypothetical protein